MQFKESESRVTY